jgi:hypothetical protein
MTATTSAIAADYRNNPFTLVYGGAITRNEPGKSTFTRSTTSSMA